MFHHGVERQRYVIRRASDGQYYESADTFGGDGVWSRQIEDAASWRNRTYAERFARYLSLACSVTARFSESELAALRAKDR